MGFTAVAGAVVMDTDEDTVAIAGVTSVSGDGVFTFRRFLPRPSWSSSSSASVAIDGAACDTAAVVAVVVVADGVGILRWLPTDASIAGFCPVAASTWVAGNDATDDELGTDDDAAP